MKSSITTSHLIKQKFLSKQLDDNTEGLLFLFLDNSKKKRKKRKEKKRTASPTPALTSKYCKHNFFLYVFFFKKTYQPLTIFYGFPKHIDHKVFFIHFNLHRINISSKLFFSFYNSIHH